jgi:hypothetical protein
MNTTAPPSTTGKMFALMPNHRENWSRTLPWRSPGGIWSIERTSIRVRASEYCCPCPDVEVLTLALSAVHMEASQLVVPVSMLLTGDSGACWQVSSK